MDLYSVVLTGEVLICVQLDLNLTAGGLLAKKVHFGTAIRECQLNIILIYSISAYVSSLVFWCV